MSALSKIQKTFPHVTKVQDSRRTLSVSVRAIDASAGRKKDPVACALVRACIRQKIADAAIIGIGTSYLIRGNIATRYKTSPAIGREITSFDRHQDFAEGNDYKLSKISQANRLGHKKWPKTGPHTSQKTDTRKIHHTADVRVLRRHK